MGGPRGTTTTKPISRIKQDELVSAISKETGVHADAVKLVLKALWPEITLRMLNGQSFVLPDVMEAYVAEYSGFFAKINVGKRKGEHIWIEPHKKLRFIEKKMMLVRLNPDNNYRKQAKQQFADTAKRRIEAEKEKREGKK